ncbi:MAG: glycosyltransferase family 2 protein [Oscillospiraceae bacterium]
MAMTKLSFVIPCYGSEKTLESVIHEITETLQTRKEFDYEIILVNDSSPDHVFSVIKKLTESNPKIKGIDLAKNFGQHAALMTGFNHVTGDIVISLDDDGQNPADEVFKLVDEIDDDHDLVFAKYGARQYSFFRNFGSKVNDAMAVFFIGKPKNLIIGTYFACKRFVIDEIIKYRNPYPYIEGLLLRATNKVKNVQVNHRERISGHSGYDFKKLFSLWINGFTAFSVKPLRVATIIGVICACFGFLYGCFVIVEKFLDPTTPTGYSSTMAALLFIGGLIMLILGMIGEYVGRIYISLNNSPQYVIRKKMNISEKADPES